MPRRPPLSRRLAAAVLLLIGTAACTSSPEPAPVATGPVAVAAPSDSPAPVVVSGCAALLAALPDELDPGVRRRPVQEETGRTAAWGDPPVLLTCGVPEPDRPDEPVRVNGVLWSVRDTGPGFRWTTTERGVNVSVDIPGEYDSGAELVNPLTGPITASLPAGPSPAPGG